MFGQHENYQWSSYRERGHLGQSANPYGCTHDQLLHRSWSIPWNVAPIWSTLPGARFVMLLQWRKPASRGSWRAMQAMCGSHNRPLRIIRGAACHAMPWPLMFLALASRPKPAMQLVCERSWSAFSALFFLTVQGLKLSKICRFQGTPFWNQEVKALCQSIWKKPAVSTGSFEFGHWWSRHMPYGAEVFPVTASNSGGVSHSTRRSACRYGQTQLHRRPDDEHGVIRGRWLRDIDWQTSD